jgi:hypothetical protein
MPENYFTSVQQGPALLPNSRADLFDIAIVHSVILNMTDIKPKLPEQNKLYAEIDKNNYIDKDGLYYGAIYYRNIGIGAETNEDNLPHAFPISRQFLSLPVIGEIVKLHKLADNTYYEKITTENSPNFNTNVALTAINTKQSNEDSNGDNGVDNLNEISSVGISDSNQNKGTNTTIKNGFAGKYFKRNLKTHQLQLNEGDTLLQGRFGHSIRFSGYLHDDKENGTQYPAILIRNGENSDNQNKKVYDVVSEDINKDGTSIQITSGKYKTLFTATIKVSKEANNTYPSSDQLIGDQLVINSGRVILSSKTAETFLFSKKTFSIFTDDIVTIDTEKGYKLISQNGNIEINAKNNKNVILSVSSGGKVFHGKDNADQQAILGNKLIDLLGQLIDVINNVQYQTYMGPSIAGGILPQYRTQLTTIKAQLKSTLSKNNYLI